MEKTVDLPMEVEKIVRFEPIEGSKGLAAVLLRVGPMLVWCKIFTDPNGEPFLSMPARKGREDKYFQTAYFTDRKVHEKAQALAIEALTLPEVSPN